MISWLERGLTDAEPSDEAAPLTEFLIAPIQAKGADAGAAKSWVESIKRERESQELRRLLYVAATRAREELHLFARPRFAVNQTSGETFLAKPAGKEMRRLYFILYDQQLHGAILPTRQTSVIDRKLIYP